MKIFHGVEFSFGYNLTIEDDCTIHKFVMLDDRGELIIRKGTSISDYAAVYSHWHKASDYYDIENRTTEIGPRHTPYLSLVGNGRGQGGRGRHAGCDGRRHPRHTAAFHLGRRAGARDQSQETGPAQVASRRR